MEPKQINQEVKQLEDKAKAELAAAKALPWKSYIVYALIVLGGTAGLIFVYNRFSGSKPTVGYQVAAPAKGMTDPPTQTVKINVPVKAYDKTLAAKKMDLPVEVTADPKTALLSTSRLKPSEGGYTTATVLNTETGESTTIAREEVRPLFAFGGKTHIGALGGISTKGMVSIGYVGQDILRVGPVNLGVAGGAGMIGSDAMAGAVIHLHGSF